MSSAQIGTKVFFAGGLTTEGMTDLVEIYDINTYEWSYLHLSVARNYSTAVSLGTKVFFAGGLDISGSAFDGIDIYDTLTQQWSFAQLSSAVFSLSALSKGNKVLFAGGGDVALRTESDLVDIYNTDTEIWTTEFLSEARAGMGAAVVGDLGFFAGGISFSTNTVTDKVDIYNFSTGEWSMDRLSEARFGIAATTVGDKIFFAGGELADGVLSNRVDIYDYSTKTWSIDTLSVARPFAGAASVCGKVYFVGGMTINTQTYQIIGDFDEIDIYDETTDSWSVEYLPYNLFAHSTISTGDQLFIAGGGTIEGEFIQLRNSVLIFTCTTVGTRDLQSKPEEFSVYPNPVINRLHITLMEECDNAELAILTMDGTLIYRKAIAGARDIELNMDDFAEGVYVVQIRATDFIASHKIVVVK